MPRLDNPNIKLKQINSFKRQNLRPWDDPSNFIPTKILEDLEKAPNKNIHFNRHDNDSANDSVATDTHLNSKRLINNKETIGKPISKQLENNNETNSNRTGASTETNSKQIVNELVSNSETNSKRISKHLTSFKTRNPIKEEGGYEESFKNTKLLVGLQKKALFYIVENCKLGGVLYTSPITNEFFKNLLNTDTNSVKTTIQRLVNKGIIKRKEGKKGNGGYTVFSITEAVRNSVIEINRQMETYKQLETNSKQTVNGIVNNKETSKETESSVVSSSYIINTTTLPEDLKQIDFSVLEDIGFNESHIIQIHREHMQKPELSLSVDIIQNSINNLAFDLKYNNVANNFKYPPAVVLTSLLKKGQPYSSKTPEKVLTPREESMREYLLAQEKKTSKLLEMETMAKKFELQEWLDALPEEELLEFNKNHAQPDGMSDRVYQTLKRKKALELAREYFDTIIWPKKHKQILNDQKA